MDAGAQPIEDYEHALAPDDDLRPGVGLALIAALLAIGLSFCIAIALSHFLP